MVALAQDQSGEQPMSADAGLAFWLGMLVGSVVAALTVAYWAWGRITEEVRSRRKVEWQLRLLREWTDQAGRQR